MKSTYRVAVVVVMVTILMANPVLLAWGNPVPGRWEKVAETKPGEKINIYTKDGIKNGCRFLSIDDDLLTCTNKFDEQIQFELATIDKVVLPRAGKYAKHGALWGAVSIGGLGAYLLAAEGGNDYNVGGNIVMTAFLAGLGSLVGMATGAALGASGKTIYISKEAALEQ